MFTFTAAFIDSCGGGVGNGKLITWSIFIAFICKIKPSMGRTSISGGENSEKKLLKTAEEYKR